MEEFIIDRNPYDDHHKLYEKDRVSIAPGLTVLVGCNGSGKSTLLHLIEDSLRQQKRRVMRFDNMTQGGHNMIERQMMMGDTQRAGSMLISSEGERISQSVGFFVQTIGSAIRHDRPKELWVLMDAVGSGLSIDAIVEIKDFISFIRGQEPDITFYFVISTNEYEFAFDSDCIDVTTFNHKKFTSYQIYKNYILRTKRKKEKRYE